MSLLFRSTTLTDVGVQSRSRSIGKVRVTADKALTHSAVWAGLRLRADLVSSMPLDAFRKVAGFDLEVPKTPVLLSPGGSDDWSMDTWLWATQYDLDRVGNTFGIIRELDQAKRPKVIELLDHRDVTVRSLPKAPAGEPNFGYWVNGSQVPNDQIWHERQYRLPGLVMGLSPISYAAASIGFYLTAQQFGIEWFTNGGTVPSGVLRNKEKTLKGSEPDEVKEKFKLAVENRDVFVTGNDWEYSTLNALANEAQFLDTQKLSALEASRFIGVPADLLDLAISGQSVTYANITQRNLQFLIMNLWPAVRRREATLSRHLMSEDRFVRFNTDAILQLDPETKSKVFGQQIRDRIRTPSEVREKYNLQPFTEEQLDEFDRLFPNRTQKPISNGDQP
ncbi:phage portal protein [Agromyces sp. SYSU T00194]|uniref:phage portal protein n=1 Tax=Agromyces chitinivorans TaxID=3158560 RepID=UPI003397ACF3